MPPIRSPPEPKIPKSPLPKPNQKPKSGDPATKSRVSLPLRRMSDPAAAAAAEASTASGAIVQAGGVGGGSWPHGVRFGDMVWGKVKSHPWWPGHVYSIDLTQDMEVHSGRREGSVLVAFFGDSSYGWFEPHELLPFDEHYPEKSTQMQVGGRNFPIALAEAVDEIGRRAALALVCPCRNPDAVRPHPVDSRYLLVDVPGFDTDAEYHPEQVTAAREKIVPRTILDYLRSAAVEQLDAADAAARTVPGMHLSSVLHAYRRYTFSPEDPTYAQAFGMDYEKVKAMEEKAAEEKRAENKSRQGKSRIWWDRKTQDEPEDAPGDSSAARPPKGRKKAAENTARRRKGGAAARLMEKIVPSASAMKPRAKKKDQYLLKRRDDARAPPPASMPEASHRPGALPDAYPAPMALALDDGPPGFPSDPPTPPLPSSTGGDEEFMLQRRSSPPLPAPAQAPAPLALPPPGQDADGTAATDAAAPKKATKPKKAQKREREEPVDAAAAGEPKKKKKKKKLAELNGVAAAAHSAGAGKPAFWSPKIDFDGLDLKQVISGLRNLPLVPSYAAGRRISDDARSFLLAFRSKCYKKSYENDSSEDNKKGSESKSNAADGTPAKKKPAVRVGEPTKAGVKRGPSDRQEELATKKKAKLNKIKALATDKRAAGLEQRDAAATALAASGTPAAPLPRAGVEKKPDAIVAKKKEPAAAPAIKTPSPTALMMKFPLKSTLPSVASLKARFARFGLLDVDGIRVYWKSHMCRVIYKFQSDAEVALKYARGNAMFGQVVPHYYLRGVESAGSEPVLDAAPPQRTELRLMETAQFRPGSSGNGAPLPLSRAVPARTVVGQPKSILKKATEDGAPAALREAPRVKFMLEAGESNLESPTAPASAGGQDAAPANKNVKSIGFAAPPLQPPARPAQQSHLQPPARPAQHLPRPAVTQPLPPPPPLQQQQHQHQPYAPMAFSVQPSLPPLPPLPLYQQPRHGDGTLVFPGQQPMPPYQPRAGGFPGQLQQPYRPSDNQLGLAGGEDTPAWKRGGREFDAEVMRIMLGIAKLVEPLTDKNGNFPYHLFRAA